MPVLGFAAIFLVVLGARWWLISAFGSSVPYLDQWNGEAASVYLPYFHGTLDWTALFAPHNEHRIALTKAFALGLLILDGQWNPLAQMITNAVIIAGAATALAVILWRLNGRRHLDVIAITIVLSFATPGGWENTIAGFQSQFYFLNLTAFIGLWMLPFARPGSLRWMAGVLLLALGLFSLATGFVAPLAAAIVAVVWGLGTGGVGRAGWINAGTALVIAVVGIMLLPETPAYLVGTRAHSVAGAASLLARCLAWPFVATEWMAVVMWAPGVLLALRAMRHRTCGPLEAYLCGLAAWLVAHALAIAWARGAASDLPPSRYMDILAVGPVINGTALAVLAHDLPARRAWVGLAAMAAFIGVTIVGVDDLSRTAVDDASIRRAWTTTYQANIRQLARDHDLERFSRLTFPGEIPWINGRDLALDWLYDPTLRGVLPPSLRDPLPLSAAGGTPFLSPGVYPSTPPLPDGAGVGSYAAGGDATMGHYRSQPIECTAGSWLRFPVAGYLGAAGTALAVQGSDGSASAVAVTKSPGERWESAFAKCPTGPFQVVAADQSASTWLAFGPPVEVGRLGRLSEAAAEQGRVVLLIGLVFAVLAARRAVA